MTQEVADREIVDEEVDIDGRTFRNVTFRDCVLVYSGGGIPLIEACSYPGTTIRYEDFAKRSLATLAYLMSPTQVVDYWMNLLHWMDPPPFWSRDYLEEHQAPRSTERAVRCFRRLEQGRLEVESEPGSDSSVEP